MNKKETRNSQNLTEIQVLSFLICLHTFLICCTYMWLWENEFGQIKILAADFSLFFYWNHTHSILHNSMCFGLLFPHSVVPQVKYFFICILRRTADYSK